MAETRTPWLAGALVLCLSCAGRQGAGAAEYFPEGSWRTSTPEEQGIDSTLLLKMLEDVRANGLGVDGVVLVRHGHLVFESYLAPYDAETTHNLKSASKSVLSALVGIALREHVLGGLDQRVSEIFPERFGAVDDPRKKQITLRHLLTMSPGLEWKEISPAAGRVWQSADWVDATIALPLTAAPGERFMYGTPFTHLASAAIARRCGSSTREYAEARLFRPMGIRAGLWRRDPQGVEFGGADLFLTPRDMARFGYLYLKNGAWKGLQLVPQEWVAESTRSQVSTGGSEGYGYWWWLDTGAVLAIGLGGQVIGVFPGLDLVVVFTGAGPETVPFALFREYIAPAMRPGRLPPNPAAARALSALEGELARPPLVEVPPIAAAAATIAASTYRIEPNPFGFTGLRLRCASAAGCAIALLRPDQETILPVGLDGRYRLAERPGFSDLPIACKGVWIDADSPAPTFALSLVEVGDPVHTEARLRFEGHGVAISVVRKAYATQSFEFTGTREDEPGAPCRLRRSDDRG